MTLLNSTRHQKLDNWLSELNNQMLSYAADTVDIVELAQRLCAYEHAKHGKTLKCSNDLLQLMNSM